MSHDTALSDELVSDAPTGGRVVTIGNFDGVHIGHQAILRAARANAQSLGVPLLAITFEPHPDTVFRGLPPEQFRISTSTERAATLERYGADSVLTFPFDDRLARLSADAFMGELLLGPIAARVVHVGYDFSYGRGREGNTETLRAQAQSCGADAVVHSPITLDGTVVSSTRVREVLKRGDLLEVARLLGRPYEISGTTESGAGRGEKMGVPTLNLYPADRLLPPFGVYACTLECEGRTYDAVTSLGVRPTYDDGDRVSLETYVLDAFPAQGRGHKIRVGLVEHLRPELRFESTAELVAAIDADVVAAKRALERYHRR